MKSLPKIARIIQVEPFKITMLWNTSEVRILDFAPLFKIWETNADSNMVKLRDWEIFKKVSLSENHTLCWVNIAVPFTFKGKTNTAPLELDALEIYRQSTLLKKVEKPNVGAMVKQARERAGLTQAAVALGSGTTRHYISRLENDKSDIQLETLQKIIEFGIGGTMRITIEDNKTWRS